MNQITSAIKKDYEALAENYETRWKKFVSPARSWLLDNLTPLKDTPLRILDLGCGTGEFLYLIANKHHNVNLIGIDLSEDMLDIAKSKLADFSNIAFESKNLETIKPQKPQYDVVINLFVLHHITNQSRFLNTLVESTKSGGDIFIADYAIDSAPMFSGEILWRLFLPSHYKAYSSRIFRKMLEEHSKIEIISFKKFSPNWFWRQQAYHLRKL